MVSGCIHEYPQFMPGKSPEKEKEEGEVKDLTNVNIDLVINFHLSWESLIYNSNYSSRGSQDTRHHFIIELALKGDSVVHEEIYLSDTDFSLGTFKHSISRTLYKDLYDVTVWYDMRGEDGSYAFNTSDLRNIVINNFATTDYKVLQCAFASDQLDLRNFEGSVDTQISKNLQMTIPGARFEVVATDVEEFIADHKADLFQGDSYHVKLSLSNGATSAFNSCTGNAMPSPDSFELSGRIPLSLSTHTELKIAEGFVFCRPEDEATIKLSVMNSWLVSVSRTDYFSFPVKRGYVTVVRGDFLTHPIDGVFSIDNIWEDEIIIEI